MLTAIKEGAKAGIKDLFQRCPPSAQEHLLSGYSRVRAIARYGKEFQRCWEFVQRSQWLDPAQLRALQAERLRALIAHAYESVPYYRAAFDERGIRPEHIQSIEDLDRLPFLTKADVRQHFDRLTSFRASRLRGHLIATSGTTGTPLRILWDARREAMETALVLRCRSWGGFQRGEPMAVFRGLDLSPRAQGHLRQWRLNRADNELHFSSSRLSDETLPEYLNALRAFRPVSIWGYPSSIWFVATHLLRRGETLGVPIKSIFLSSEPLHDWQREAIEDAFDAPVFDRYGLSEGVVSAEECERHAGYHVSVESSIVEIVPSAEVPGLCEIVATGLDNFMMPLIRYRTGDAGTWLNASCPCGRGLPLLGQVQTKMDDAVVTSDGRWISPSVLTFPFKLVRGIAKSQIIQRSLTELTVRVVPEDAFSPREEAKLVAALHARLGDGIAVSVERVADIARTSAGKYRWVVSEIEQHRPAPREIEDTDARRGGRSTWLGT